MIRFKNPCQTHCWRRDRRLRMAALAGCLFAIAWLVVSFLLACLLTSRARKPFVEVVPKPPQLSVQSFQLTTVDGETIGCWYVPGSKDQPIVLLIHGNGGHRATRWTQAAMLHQFGYSVLLISCRAHGDSTGNLNDFGFGARHDVVAAVRWMAKESADRPIVIWGASLGAAAAVFAMDQIGQDVQGLILECPYRDLQTAVWHRMQFYLPPLLDSIGYSGVRFAGGILLPHLQQISPVTAIRTIPVAVPVLILAGGADQRARPAEARELQQQIEGQATLVVFENADHLGLHEADGKKYQEVVLQFLNPIATTHSSRAQRVAKP